MNVLRLLLRVTAALSLLTAAVAAILYLHIANGFPDMSRLNDPQGLRKVICDLHRSEDGFQTNPITKETVPPYVRNAFLAAWDRSFFTDARVIQEQCGNPVMDMVTRSLIPRERTYIARLRDAVFRLELSLRLDREEIFTLWLNTLSFHHGVYGVDAAAGFYFGKGAAELDVGEAAMLAATPFMPRYTPLTNPELAMQRRDYVLHMMCREGMITQSEHDKALAGPCAVIAVPKQGTSSGPALRPNN